MPTEAIIAAAEAAINRIDADPGIPISREPGAGPLDVREAAKVVATELQPVVAHLTNSEPWYASRVTLGALFAVVGSFCAAFGIRWLTPEQTVATINLIALLAPVVGGAAITLYGRWAAKKPLGA